jgi:hypothetical protein
MLYWVLVDDHGNFMSWSTSGSTILKRNHQSNGYQSQEYYYPYTEQCSHRVTQNLPLKCDQCRCSDMKVRKIRHEVWERPSCPRTFVISYKIHPVGASDINKCVSVVWEDLKLVVVRNVGYWFALLGKISSYHREGILRYWSTTTYPMTMKLQRATVYIFNNGFTKLRKSSR